MCIRDSQKRGSHHGAHQPRGDRLLRQACMWRHGRSCLLYTSKQAPTISVEADDNYNLHNKVSAGYYLLNLTSRDADRTFVIDAKDTTDAEEENDTGIDYVEDVYKRQPLMQGNQFGGRPIPPMPPMPQAHQMPEMPQNRCV